MQNYRFNSTKVRLRLKNFAQDVEMKLGFNSTKVRLRRAAGRLSGKGRKFQFHKGSIKTRSLFPYVTLRKSFNSTKVRLRRFISYILLHYAICFNSTKVRLRLSGRNLRCVRKSFQFHKGSIKTPICT